jgi:hypothetical protein
MRVQFLLAGLLVCSACVSHPRCREYIPGIPTGYSTVEVIQRNSTGPATLTVVTSNGTTPVGPVQLDITAESGAHFRADSAQATIPWSGGRTRIRVRATGYRPADSTVTLTPGAQTAIRVRLLSMVIGHPELLICDQ